MVSKLSRLLHSRCKVSALGQGSLPGVCHTPVAWAMPAAPAVQFVHPSFLDCCILGAKFQLWARGRSRGCATPPSRGRCPLPLLCNLCIQAFSTAAFRMQSFSFGLSQSWANKPSAPNQGCPEDKTQPEPGKLGEQTLCSGSKEKPRNLSFRSAESVRLSHLGLLKSTEASQSGN